MNGFLHPLLEIEGFVKIIDALEKGRSPVLATNVIDSQKIHLSYGLAQRLKTNAVYITFSELRAKEIYEDLTYFLKDQVKFYPSKDILFYSADVRSIGITKQRFEIIESLLKEEDVTIVLSVEALFDRLTDKNVFQSHILKLEVGDERPQEQFIQQLVFDGYERCDLVEGAGQFAVRGGILDIYPPNLDYPVRMEFWGDEIDSIRMLDANSQKSIEKLTSVTLFPMRELVYTQAELDNAMEKMRKELEKTTKNYEKKGLFEESATLKGTISEALEKMEQLKNFNGIERFSQYFYDKDTSLLDYLPKGTLLFVDEPSRVSTHSETVLQEFHESIKNRILRGQLLPSGGNMVYSYVDMVTRMASFPTVLLMSLTHSIKEFQPKEIANFVVKSSSIMQERMDLLMDDLRYYCNNQYRILILAGASIRGERLLREFSENHFSCTFVENLEQVTLQPSIITISTGNLNRGFEYQEIKLVVITDKELFSREKQRKKSTQKKKGTKIESFTDLSIGDYVVHENHGIGVYEGIEKITTDNISKDYLKLAYADGGHLYIPTSQMDMVQKYIGGEGSHVKLNKLGGAEWGKAKQKAKKSVAILAKELIELYAKRQAQQGHVFEKDTVWQKEFEELFPYEETDDQKMAIEDVKRDMESRKVMDRLICGDVGYGKTEVAIRGAFKCVQDGKQVAYLVPTTILAQQHYNTFVQRMNDFGVNVALLSRFRTPKQQKESIDGLRSGMVDIVIGTHKLFGKNVEFKNLGLIIIDEEQRFGVRQKENLKRLRENTDVLALSATPIPRTLHMSLTGIRDISILEEPPQERQPIQTYVMEYNDEFVRDAIHRELARGGQVFYLHNRVRNISEVALRVQKLVPEARLAYAHGQLSERELESIMMDFVEGKLDVLVCTTIIETGLDISNANTIIIQDADYMGLSQLYQLRGRVGRSNRAAFAYLMYKKDKMLNEIAEKRLQTIRDFTEFGSGFKVAMRDLEIRGAGNVLGAEQHGHMESIGYDMFCKLLDEEVRRLKGEEVEEAFETLIDIQINAFIPGRFIKNEEQKLEIYKKIALMQNQQDYYDIQEEIEDRYGTLPEAVQNLLDIAYTKAIAHDKGVLSLIQKNRNIVINLKPDAKLKAEQVADLILKYKGKLFFTNQTPPYFTYKLSNEKSNEMLGEIQKLLQMFS